MEKAGKRGCHSRVLTLDFLIRQASQAVCVRDDEWAEIVAEGAFAAAALFDMSTNMMMAGLHEQRLPRRHQDRSSVGVSSDAVEGCTE